MPKRSKPSYNRIVSSNSFYTEPVYPSSTIYDPPLKDEMVYNRIEESIKCENYSSTYPSSTIYDPPPKVAMVYNRIKKIFCDGSTEGGGASPISMSTMSQSEYDSLSVSEFVSMTI